MIKNYFFILEQGLEPHDFRQSGFFFGADLFFFSADLFDLGGFALFSDTGLFFFSADLFDLSA